MLKKQKLKTIWLLVICIFLIATFLVFRYGPRFLPSPQSPPVRPLGERQYFQIINEDNGQTLTYVSVPVQIGDEYITSDNRRFVVVKVKGNKAYARYKGRV